ncbi:hypothetical protein [Methylobacterium sp. PvR107]|uniref:hypothetical protein n=1 Tax=Methylobacterium sp. PvR107 TaxID=2806597 RepID=UPI001B4A346F|nr:hypothetical protein [Methylobacterium sp. PvR107]MBP1180980.1 hypothetical protein [Methylobacterium sp. PvR107]
MPPFYPDRSDWDASEPDWTADRDEPHRARGGLRPARCAPEVRNPGAAGGFFLYDSLADCSGRPAAGWLGLVGAGACARSELPGSVLSMQDNVAVLKRPID